MQDASFGRWLKQRRKACDLTQDTLARDVGCAVITIKKIEADALRPSKQIAERLASALDVPPAERTAVIRLARANPGLERASAAAQALPLTPAVQEQEDLGGRVIKGFELRERIGSGGFGVVYRAYQHLLGREVAFKVILPQYANHPDFIRRFEAEAQLVAQIEHPHIVPLYDYWREPSGAYLVMRFLRGGNLQGALKDGPLTLQHSITVLKQLTGALASAHRRGVVHRDVKPANVLLDLDGNLYLADFGIAKELGVVQPDADTQPATIIGSPAYLAPEQIRDEPVSPQTDIYSLGVLLYELLAGTQPFPNLSPGEVLLKHLFEPLPSLTMCRPELPFSLDMVIQRATAKNVAERYPSVQHLLDELQQAATQGTAESPGQSALLGTVHHSMGDKGGELPAPADSPAQWLANPYKGLRAFSEADEADFFGRESLIQQLLARLAEENTTARFLAVVGPSGSGKSSVVRAGLLPALRRGGLPGSERWFIAEVIPGAHPLEELEAALLRIAVNPPESLRSQLQENERGLLRAVKRVLPADEAVELVLMIDQFEEVFALVSDAAVRDHLLDSLLAVVSDPRARVRVIITLRADFYDRPLVYTRFGELMLQHTAFVLPLTHDELQAAITSPAERAGLTLEPGLVSAIVKDVSEQPGMLPLLQYALTELFERQEGRSLTLKAYHECGGVLGALSRRADELFVALDAQAQAAARQLFLRLITPGDGTEDTRRRVRSAELTGNDGAMETVIDLYGRYRLLTFDRDPITRGPTIEIAHEALIRTWARMRSWIEASREDLRVQRRLIETATEWANADHDPSFLAIGVRLSQFTALAQAGDLPLNDMEQAYLDASIAERDRQVAAERERLTHELALTQQVVAAQRRAAHRLRVLVGALTLFLVLAVGLIAVASTQRQTAQANLTRSEAQRLAAEANRLLQADGNAEVIALLSIRSMRMQYTPQGDAALLGAAALDLPRQLFAGSTLNLSSVAFSPDGRFVLTGSIDQTARLWETQTGEELRAFRGHTAEVSSVAFSPDGKYVLTGSWDKTARLWNAQTGEELRRFSGHTSDVLSVAFSADGRFVLTGSLDETARLWDLDTGAEVRKFSSSAGAVRAVYAPHNQSVLTGNSDGTARLWDIQTGNELRQFVGHTDLVSSVAFSSDGAHVLTGSFDFTARLWNAQTGAQVQIFAGHTDYIRHVALSPDGKYVLTGSLDRTVRLWDAQSGRELRRFTGHTSAVYGVAFSQDGKYVLSGSIDKTARLWEVQPTRKLPQFSGHSVPVNTVHFLPDGRSILTISDDRTVRLWDVRTGAETRRFDTPWGYSAALSADGAQMLTGYEDATARLWDAQTGAGLRTFTGHTDDVTSVAFSPDGKYVLTGSWDETVRLWDAQTGEELRQFTGHTAPVFAVTYAPNGQYILTGSPDNTARLWDVESGAQLRSFNIPNRTGSQNGAYSVAFSRDSTYGLTGGSDGLVQLWDLSTGAELQRFAGHSDVVLSVAFSPDGQLVLTGSQDATARLWDAQTGIELRRLAGTQSGVLSVAFSPDGKYVLTGSADGTVRLWDTDYQNLIQYLCGRLLRDFSDDERAQYNITDEPTCPHQ
jgi:WD40 repeat protein/serine/threonine protein kinase/DNA-binding XRE family transcriptional regulator